jgi:hypothetical protein
MSVRDTYNGYETHSMILIETQKFKVGISCADKSKNSEYFNPLKRRLYVTILGSNRVDESG